MTPERVREIARILVTLQRKDPNCVPYQILVHAMRLDGIEMLRDRDVARALGHLPPTRGLGLSAEHGFSSSPAFEVLMEVYVERKRQRID